MHILLTNDDGPPNPHASPYLETFVRVLSSPPFSHKIHVIIPSTQRSWIGKAHLLPPSTYAIPGKTQKSSGSSNEVLEDTVTPTFYDPSTGEVHNAPANADENQRWVLVPGTPATCVQLGLFQREHLFPSLKGHSGPFDLLLSGPNLGRNTTAAFALSSGTLGGALEGAICGLKSFAVSYAFFTKKEPEAWVEEASVLTCRIVEKLLKTWNADDGDANETTHNDTTTRSHPKRPEVYTINVPLVEDVSNRPVKWTWMLDNKWMAGSLYKQVQAEGAPLSFQWSPNFSDVWKTVEESEPGNDGQVIRSGCTSVTALRANFEGFYGGGYKGEIKL